MEYEAYLGAVRDLVPDKEAEPSNHPDLDAELGATAYVAQCME